MIAASDPYRLKLVISDWVLGPGAEAGSEAGPERGQGSG
jgi:hypothetical protein